MLTEYISIYRKSRYIEIYDENVISCWQGGSVVQTVLLIQHPGHLR